MMSLKCTGLSMLVAAVVGFTAAAYGQTNSPILNLNSDMELGVAGRAGAPGYRLVVNRLVHQEADKNPDRMYVPMTQTGGQSGQCLEIPGYLGMQNYQIELADLNIRQDCDIEISFDARVGPDEFGKEHPASSYFVDFRAMGNPAVGEQTYPMIKNFGFKPTAQWQHFSTRYSIKGRTNFHTVWIAGTGALGEPAQNALYLDNFVVRRVEKDTHVADQAAAIPDRVEPVYSLNDTVDLTLRAGVASESEQLNATLVLRSDLDDSVLASYPVTLARSASLPDHRSVYQGQVTAKASRFGTFHSDIIVAGQPLAVLGGEFAVIHPAVAHPRFSPGWRIGYNGTIAPMGRAGPPYDYRDFRWVQFGSFERSFRIAHQAGMSLQRMWGYWRLLEPSEGDWRTDVISPVLDLNRKYNLETIFCIGANMTVHENKQWLERQIAIGRSPWPTYLLQYHHDEGSRGSINPPPEVFARYLDFAIKSWGNQIHIWELFNEPGIGGFPADKYIGYLTQTYQAVKKNNPNDIVLGNGVTGDFGMNVIKWCQSLNASNPDYPQYMDGAAFHPYNLAMDYQNGRYGQYTQCVADIRAQLKIKKPLWNTECFYLLDARRPQIPWPQNQSHFGANEVQRHLLESLELNVAGMTSFQEETFVKRTAPATVPVLSQEALGGNALSWLLADMQNLEMVPLNRFVKAGLFTDKAGTKAVGYLYDMRPAGSTWTLPQNRGGVQVVDLFGNPVAAGEQKIFLTYEPYYLLGSPAEVKSWLASAQLAPRRSVEVSGRVFQDQLFLEAHNVSGIENFSTGIVMDPQKGLALPGQITWQFSAGRERDRMIVQRAIRSGFDSSAPLTWHAAARDQLAGSAEPMKLLPVAGSYEIPMSRQDNLTLNKGSKGAIWSDDKSLYVSVTVADKQIVAAKDKDLWNGDAVEIFIDPKPLENFDIAGVTDESQRLDIWQHIFAVKPSGSQTEQLAINKSRGKVTTQATRSVSLNDNGYTLTASIPWEEILASGTRDQVIGLDIDVDLADGKNVQKESLGSKPGQSYQERLHYPLFRIPDAVIHAHKALLQKSDKQSEEPSALIRMDIVSKEAALAAGEAKGVSIQFADWLKTDRDKRLIVTGTATAQWQTYSFRFVPSESGKIAIHLMGDSESAMHPLCRFDDLRVEGASAIQNGSFEQLNASGLPVGWSVLNQPVLMHEAANAADGDHDVMTNHDNRFVQEIAVVKNQPVTISFQAQSAAYQRVCRQP